MNMILEISAYTNDALTDSQWKAEPSPYKFGPAVDKYRRLPKTPENIRAHGDAICAAVRSKQRAALEQAIKYQPISCPCASGTWHTDGKALLKAIVERQAASIRNALAESWRARTDEQVRLAYEAAMRGEDAPLTHNIYVPKARS